MVAIKGGPGNPLEVTLTRTAEPATAIVTLVPVGLDDKVRRTIIRAAHIACDDLNRVSKVTPPLTTKPKAPDRTFRPVKWKGHGESGEGHNGRLYQIWSESYAGRHGDRQHHGQMKRDMEGAVSSRIGAEKWEDVTDQYTRKQAAKSAIERYEIEQLLKEYPELLTVKTQMWIIDGKPRFDAFWMSHDVRQTTSETFVSRAEAKDAAWLSIIESRKPYRIT